MEAPPEPVVRTEEEVWQTTPPSRLWKLDKLLLALHLGYQAGPAGVDVPRPGAYVVRPCVNAMGMARGASYVELHQSTDHLPPGSFWCEPFGGRHLSVDYLLGRPRLVVEAEPSGFFGRPACWIQRPRGWAPKIPGVLEEEPGIVNAEFIGGRLIEVHLRPNPDFRWGNRQAVPVWRGEAAIDVPPGWRWVPERDGDRLGLLIK